MPSASYIIGSATIWNQKPGVVYEYLTSTVYPIEGLETLEVAPAVNKALFWFIDIPVLDMQPAVTQCLLRAIITTHDQPNEDVLELSASAISVTLDQIVVEHDQPNDDVIELSAAISQAELVTIVIVHDQPNDDILDVAPSVTAVYLGAP